VSNAANEPDEGWYKIEEHVIESVGVVRVETVNFPPYPDLSGFTKADWDNYKGYEYCGFESCLVLPDGSRYGHGPEWTGETPAQVHASWTPEAIAAAVRDHYRKEI